MDWIWIGYIIRDGLSLGRVYDSIFLLGVDWLCVTMYLTSEWTLRGLISRGNLFLCDWVWARCVTISLTSEWTLRGLGSGGNLFLYEVGLGWVCDHASDL